jgi:hypothetical protein
MLAADGGTFSISRFGRFDFTETICDARLIKSGLRGGAGGLGLCATVPQLTGSISDGVIGIFHSLNSSGRTMALGSTQPLTEMSIRGISWGVMTAGAYG